MNRIVIILAACAAAPLAAQRLTSPRAASGVELEGQVSAAQATQGALIRQDMSAFGVGWSGGAQLFWQAPGDGARMRVPFTTSAAGRNELILWFTRAPDYGQFDVRVDGGPVVTLDGYAPSVVRDSALLGVFDLAAGGHELLFVVSGKAGASGGFLVGLDRLGWRAAAPRSATSLRSGAQPAAAASGLIGNIANADTPRARGTAPRTGTIANAPRVPVIHLQEANLLPDMQTAPPHASRAGAPLTASEKSVIALAAMGNFEHGTSSLMSQNGLQADEEGTMRLTAAQPVIEGRANLSFGDAISYSSWPLVRFRLYPSVSPLSQQLKPFFNVSFKTEAAEHPYLIDCEVDVGGEAIFETAGQTVALSGVTRHYTLLAMASKSGWQTVSVVLRSGKLIPGGIWMGVDLRSCEITPLK